MTAMSPWKMAEKPGKLYVDRRTYVDRRAYVNARCVSTWVSALVISHSDVVIPPFNRRPPYNICLNNHKVFVGCLGYYCLLPTAARGGGGG